MIKQKPDKIYRAAGARLVFAALMIGVAIIAHTISIYVWKMERAASWLGLI